MVHNIGKLVSGILSVIAILVGIYMTITDNPNWLALTVGGFLMAIIVASQDVREGNRYEESIYLLQKLSINDKL